MTDFFRLLSGAFDVNIVFGIKNLEFNSGFKKMTKVMCLVKVALVVVVENGIWQNFMFNSRRPQRKLLNLKFC